MDLTGLTPEQINAALRTDIMQNNTMVDAAKGLSLRRMAEVGNELVPVQIGDNTLKIQRKHLQTAGHYAAQNRTEDFQIDGQTYHIPYDKQAGMIKELRETANNPTEMKALKALTDSYGARAEASRASAARDIALTPADKVLKEKTGDYYEAMGKSQIKKANRDSDQQAAIAALYGVTDPKEFFKDENLYNTITARPEVLGALANQAGSGVEEAGVDLAEKRKVLTELIRTSPKKMDMNTINVYNTLAEEVDFDMMVGNIDGKPTYIQLPIVLGTQMTPKMVRAFAETDGYTIDEALAIIHEEVLANTHEEVGDQ